MEHAQTTFDVDMCRSTVYIWSGLAKIGLFFFYFRLYERIRNPAGLFVLMRFPTFVFAFLFFFDWLNAFRRGKTGLCF